MPAKGPESTPFVREGNVLYEGVASLEEIDRKLREGIADEEELLNQLLAYNHDLLVDTGIADKVTELNLAWTVSQEDSVRSWGFDDLDYEKVRDIEGLFGDPEEKAEESVIPIDEFTQFRVGENLDDPDAEEPSGRTLDGSTLFVVIHNDHDELGGNRDLAVGDRMYMPDGIDDLVIPKTPGASEELHLTELEVATVALLVAKIKEPWQKGRLPHLGRNGRYDTLVVEVPQDKSAAA